MYIQNIIEIDNIIYNAYILSIKSYLVITPEIVHYLINIMDTG